MRQRPAPPTPAGDGALSPDARARAWRVAAAGPVDVVVVGGGPLGCACALDAATRGLSVVLVEAADLGSGGSSRTVTLLDGGLGGPDRSWRPSLRELAERTLLLTRLAPQLATPVEPVVLLRRRSDRARFAGALVAADVLGHRRDGVLGRHRHLDARATLVAVPALAPGVVAGGERLPAAVVDDARHVVALARTAAAHGAAVLTRVAVRGLVRDGDRVVGVTVVDGEDPATPPLEVRAGVVIDTTGGASAEGWTDRRGEAAATAWTLVVPGADLAAGDGLVVPDADSAVVVLPWEGRWLVTSLGADRPPPRSGAGHPDAGALRYALGRVLRRPLPPPAGVELATWARPAGVPAGVGEVSPGLASAGRRSWATTRLVARDAVDHAVAALRELDADRPSTPSVTARVPLVGAEGWAARAADAERLADAHGIDPVLVDRLVRRHGAGVDDVLALVGRDPELGRALDGLPGVLAVEVVHAATHEGARRVADVLARRTRAAATDPAASRAARPAVARLLAPVLGWDDARTAAEARAPDEG